MFRMTFLLCAALFLTLLLAGEDRGQRRFGLMPQEAPAAAVIAVAEPVAPVAETPSPAPVVAAVFAPERPVMATPAVVAAPAPLAAPEPAEEALPLRIVSARAANLRQGPGTDFAVVGRLTRGEAVEVLGDDGTGWLRVRAQASGAEGHVSASLLTE